MLSARHTEIITDLLRRNTSLASLSFAHSSLPQGLLPTVVELLLDHPNVQHFRELNLEGVGLGDDGTQRCSVRVVIACSPLYRSFGNAPDMDDLCELIEEHRSLDSLNLSHNVALTDEGVDWLVQAVGGDGAHTRSLDTIHLAGCPLVSESARERVDHAIHSALRILKTPDQGNHSSHNMLRAVPVVPVKRKSLCVCVWLVSHQNTRCMDRVNAGGGTDAACDLSQHRRPPAGFLWGTIPGTPRSAGAHAKA